MSTPFSRRLFLRGFGGIAIGLPALEFMQGRGRAWAQAAPPKRFLVFFEHGGTLTNHSYGVYGYGGFTDGSSDMQGMDGWRPVSTPGQPLQLGPIHQPLTDANLIPYLNVVRGVDNKAGEDQGDYGNGHGISNVTVLTGGQGKLPGEPDSAAIAYVPSIDQVVASRWGAPAGGMASINLEIPAHNYGSPFFKGPKQYASSYDDPNAAFTAILSNVSTSTAGPDPTVLRAQALRVSVLDGTGQSLQRYQNKMSAADKLTVQAHLDNLRSIEQRVAAMPAPPAPGCSKPTVNGTYTDVGNTWQIMIDIGLAALRCGQTRVMGIQVGDFHATWDPTPLPFDVGYNIGHSLHHMARDLGKTGMLYVPHPTWLTPWQQCMLRNRQLRSQMVARWLTGLRDTPEGSGNMLDNSLFMWTSEFSLGAQHLGTDLPFIVGGKAGGALQTGRYINYNTKAATDDFTMNYLSQTTTNNVYISLMNMLGFSDTTFGDMKYSYKPGAAVGL
jgi:hypothetical protein